MRERENNLNDTSPERANRLDEPERPTIGPTEEIESSPERAPTLRRNSRRKKANVQPFFLNDIDDGSSQAFYKVKIKTKRLVVTQTALRDFNRRSC